MQHTEKIWFNGKFVPWDEANTHVMTHAIHYGTAVFEGIRMYKTARGSAIFQLNRHVDRLFYSAESIGLQIPYTKQQITQAIIETVRANKMVECYIRPIIYYGFEELKVVPTNCPTEIAIAVWPWGAYLKDDSVRVFIPDIIRLHPRTSVVDAKISGHYINSMLAGREAIKKGFDEALLLDYEGNIAEGPGENFFMVKDDKVITPTIHSILPGITRSSIMALSADLGYQVEERPIKREEAYSADECFFTGTAAEITPICSIDDKKMKYPCGPITTRLKEYFIKITRGENENYAHWLTFI